MVCMDFPPVARGAGYHAYNLSKKLIEKGHNVTVFTRGSWKKTYYEEIDGISVYRVRFIPIYPLHLLIHGTFINRMLRSMESNFDVVHLHNPVIPFVHTSVPILLTQHGSIKSGIAHRDSMDLFSLGSKIFSAILISTERKLVNSADKVTAVSKSCAEELKMYYGLKDVEVVHNGVDTNFFFVQNEMKKENELYILYAGSLDALKGLTDLIKCAKFVHQERQNVKFILAGRGPLEEKLKKIVHNFDLDENFSFVGYVNQGTLLKYYQNATIFVHTSYHEGLPTTILEAMSCGIPVVATAVAGTSEVVMEGETGFLVPPKSPDKLATAILSLLNDKELRERIGKNARKYVEEKYNWNTISEGYEKIYSNLMGIENEK